MAWSQEQRLQFLGELESARRVLTAFYRCLMGLVSVGILIISIWVFAWRPLGPGHQGEYFYFGAAALFLLGWALSQVFQPTRRLRRSLLPNVTVETKAVEGGRAWEVRLGSTDHEPADAVRADFSRSFSIPLASVAAELLPNEESLTCLEAEIARGIDLDAACRTIQPAYEDWGTLQRRAYRMYVKSVLAERQRG
ncbi:MAG: hypothetical protein L0228_08850 [Planctomycetes bacterium]|nr:hypothetical protein [Planctomycetota bacterium]